MDSMGEFPEKRFHDPGQREETDFSIWIEDAGRVELQVTGARYCVEGGEWFPEGPGGVDGRAA